MSHKITAVDFKLMLKNLGFRIKRTWLLPFQDVYGYEVVSKCKGKLILYFKNGYVHWINYGPEDFGSSAPYDAFYDYFYGEFKKARTKAIGEFIKIRNMDLNRLNIFS